MFLKGKNLIKIHNCFSCHKVFKNVLKFYFYPKIKNQHLDYLVWSLINYQKILYRKNIFMSSQLQNLSVKDMKRIFFFLNNLY